MDFLTPSQFISVLLLAGGMILLAIELFVDGKKAPAAAEAVPAEDAPVETAETAEGEAHE